MTRTVEVPLPAPDLEHAERILARCDALAELSADPGTLERVHLSPEHTAASALVARWMHDAGLATWQDAAGNRWGRLEGHVPGLPALVLGSHIDTVPDAGRYDGMLGVLLAIEVAARTAATRRGLPFALEVVAFSDEEGTRFGNALSGSRAVAGTWDPAWWALTDRDGVTLPEAFEAFGLDPARVGDAARDPASLVGYLEAHIEQGPHLEDAGRALGVVTCIAGARRFSLVITGHAGHAGGTPYDRRRDALVGASELVVAIERIGRATGTIATVGRLQAYPGGINVIPGRVEMSVDLRAEHDEARDAAWDEIVAASREIEVRRGLYIEATEIYRADAVPCDASLQQAVAAGVRATCDADPLAVFSRAGHDAMAMAALTPMAMLFVRCAGGVSHHPDESVTAQDVALALDALEAAVVALATTSEGDRAAGSYPADRGAAARSARAAGVSTSSPPPRSVQSTTTAR